MCGVMAKIVHADGHGCVAGETHVLKSVGGAEEDGCLPSPVRFAERVRERDGGFQSLKIFEKNYLQLQAVKT